LAYSTCFAVHVERCTGSCSGSSSTLTVLLCKAAGRGDEFILGCDVLGLVSSVDRLAQHKSVELPCPKANGGSPRKHEPVQ